MKIVENHSRTATGVAHRVRSVRGEYTFANCGRAIRNTEIEHRDTVPDNACGNCNWPEDTEASQTDEKAV